MTEASDSNNTNNVCSARLNYWKVIPLSLIGCTLINLIAFGLRIVIFGNGEIIEIMLTLMFSIIVSILIGIGLISKQKKNIGWSLIIGACLSLLFWIGAFYSLTTNGW